MSTIEKTIKGLKWFIALFCSYILPKEDVFVEHGVSGGVTRSQRGQR